MNQEKPNLTPEQKERNQQYILDNLDNYWPDSKGDFVNTDSDTYGEDYFWIGKYQVTDYKDILWEMAKKITEREKEDWELIFSETDEPFPKYFKNKKTGLELSTSWFGEVSKYLIGELGYRGWHNGKRNEIGVLIWDDYDRDRIFIKQGWENRKKTKPSSPHSPPPTNPKVETSQETENQESKKTKKQAEQESQNQNPNSTPTDNNTPDQPNQSPNQEPQEQPTNNRLPSPETIQENYNNDKDKSTIENNPNSTTPEQKEQSEALLKLVIEAEFLIKDKQFNSETLSKLLKEKEQNTETYQLLKERIEQAINELSSLEQKQNNNNEPTTANEPYSISPIQIFAIVGVIGVVSVVSLVVIKKIKKLRKPSSKNK
ncbi:protein of unknown function [endosymbiont DhMRE of Dentiscutata heterogama]|uniref:hypothetical protein n=1 Tax=endosymbiont DhMRE of Dentiscutata heterogama TaxID=1609546 RepID=UPI000629D319|nr:hypothetical protein [endosymbiont DhMRE of Dentiscutata heterogama]CFW92801.1 protein of unknown function [endosymbiont DhMRE of Dentiscutata heterogama]